MQKIELHFKINSQFYVNKVEAEKRDLTNQGYKIADFNNNTITFKK